MRALALVIATGGGAGYTPIAPGTAGFIIGLVVLLRPPLRSIESFETWDKWDADSRGVNDGRGSADRIVVQDV